MFSTGTAVSTTIFNKVVISGLFLVEKEMINKISNAEQSVQLLHNCSPEEALFVISRSWTWNQARAVIFLAIYILSIIFFKLSCKWPIKVDHLKTTMKCHNILPKSWAPHQLYSV